MEMKKSGIFSWICMFIAALSCDKCVNGSITLKGTQCFNHIPHNIPDNVTRVVLRDVKNVENVKNGMFDGKNWDKVKYLVIFKTPESVTTISRTDQESSCSKEEINMNSKNTTSSTATVLSDHKVTQPLKNGQVMTKYIKTIEPYAMENLISLEELHIESNSFEGLDYGSFTGLTRLKVLSFKTCEHLMLESIIKAINGSETVPNLQTFSITYINVGNGVKLGKEFFTAISTKPLQLLGMHKILVNNVQAKYLSGILLNSLKILNASDITLNQIDTDDMESIIFKQPRLFDVSSITLPMGLFRLTKFPLDLLANSMFPLDLNNTTILTNFESLNFSNINHLPIIFKNVTLLLLNTKYENWQIKNLILSRNNLYHLDVTIPCVHSSLEMIDLSYNGITFLRPNFCPCCFTLKKLILAYNNLHEMSKFNNSLFSKIFSYYPRLVEIYLTSNELTSIPEEAFKENFMLEIIDLSHNKLEHVRFCLLQLKNLKQLNLQYNKITILDTISLNNIPVKLFKPNVSQVLDFRHNPLSCSKCDTLQSIQWLATSHFSIRSEPDFVCINNNDDFIAVDRNAVTSVQKICDRPKHIRNIILLGTFIPVVSIILIIATTCIIRMYHQHKQYTINMAEKIRLIREDATDTKFVVFLCFCSDDEGFVSTNVYQPMNQYLQNIIGTIRDLVAYGDKQFRPGQPVNDEMVRCLEQSLVVIVILSRNFCTSEYCRMEFDHALRMDKPIVLMLKEEVSEEEMVPSLRNIFRKNTRILWENQADGYQLKTSWENVCTSILELV